MLAGVQLFVSLDWSRFGLWLAAILLGGAGFGAAGAALGAAARDVRAVSLLAFMVSLPIALLSLVPSGAVGAGLYDVIRVLTALFPFKPALEAIPERPRLRRPRHRRAAAPPGGPHRRLRAAGATRPAPLLHGLSGSTRGRVPA